MYEYLPFINYMNIKRSDFYPLQDLSTKHNYKRIFRLGWDSTIIERVCLDIADSKVREEIIARHYIINYKAIFFSKLKDVYILDRDFPRDFKVKLNNECIFNIEITSIADNEDLFKIYNDQDRFMKNTHNKEISFNELKKVNERFINEEINEKIERYNQLL